MAENQIQSADAADAANFISPFQHVWKRERERERKNDLKVPICDLNSWANWSVSVANGDRFACGSVQQLKAMNGNGWLIASG